METAYYLLAAVFSLHLVRLVYLEKQLRKERRRVLFVRECMMRALGHLDAEAHHIAKHRRAEAAFARRHAVNALKGAA